MQNSDKIWFSGEMIKLFQLYGRKPEGSDNLLEAYWEALAPSATPEVAEAFKRVREACKTFPLPAHFLEQIKIFKQEQKSKIKPATTNPFGRCPKCGFDTKEAEVPEKSGDFYEVCLNPDCKYREILRTFKEWDIIYGVEHLTLIEKSKYFRDLREYEEGKLPAPPVIPNQGVN